MNDESRVFHQELVAYFCPCPVRVHLHVDDLGPSRLVHVHEEEVIVSPGESTTTREFRAPRLVSQKPAIIGPNPRLSDKTNYTPWVIFAVFSWEGVTARCPWRSRWR
eukprot:Polyplicarium_translucidae@DN2251_c0_g1_i2.p2